MWALLGERFVVQIRRDTSANRVDDAPSELWQPMRRRTLRFDRVAISSVFGDPGEARTWSGAPYNLGRALADLGVVVDGIHPRLSQLDRYWIAARQCLRLRSRPPTSEYILRDAVARRELAHQVASAARASGFNHVLHTGTLDLPAHDAESGVRHYLYCDHTWALSLANRPERRVALRTDDQFDRLERQSYRGLTHIFTFGNYVKDNLVRHYSVPAERVTVVGSGMGPIRPYFGERRYDRPALLFVAKHLFAAKGGHLLLDAFRIAQRRIPELSLCVVGDERSRRLVPHQRNITVRAHLSWLELEALYRDATLLVQPMLNDPWGQVYLEALASRTPVIGLRRNGLPEILANGRHGFLVDADPYELAATILDALSDPERLARMGVAGQRHVLTRYSWDRVAASIALT
jgi:glycosyltransferase involved in cell wall biosynthesis